MVKVKIMHISTVNISQMVTDKTDCSYQHMKLHVVFRLAYCHLTFAHSKVKAKVMHIMHIYI